MGGVLKINMDLPSQQPPISPDLIERFPQEVRDKVRNARLAYFALFEEFKNSLLQIPYFDEVLSHNNNMFFDIVTNGNVSPIKNLDDRKRELMVRVLQDIFSLRDMFIDNSIPDFLTTRTENGVKVESES